MTGMLGPYILGPNDTPENGIYTGDARELAQAIPDESIDLIFTDPVYDQIDDYQWLTEMAAKKLKVTGSLLVFQWAGFLRETFMVVLSLAYEGLLALYIPNRTKDTRNKVGFNKWTPCLWMSRGQVKSPKAHDILRCNAFEPVFGDGSSNHPWSKSPEFFAYYITALKPEVILDPFCGGGTVPAVCKMLGRKYLAFEIDPEVAEKARERVRNTNPPLFVLEPEQTSFLEAE